MPLVSPSWPPLLDALAEAVSRPRDPGERPWVLCPSPWMARWLEQALAARLGVVAGLRWATPAEWLDAVLPAHRPGEFGRAALAWRVRGALKVGGPGLDGLHAALRQATPVNRQWLCEGWAARLDLDDRFRPEAVRGWLAAPEATVRHDAHAMLLRAVHDAGERPRSVRVVDWRPAPDEVPLAVWAAELAPIQQEALARAATVGPAPVHLVWAPPPAAPHADTRLVLGAGPRDLMIRLRTELAGLFAAQPDLRPGDVRVLTPDPDGLCPWFEAVFGDPAPGEPTLPVRVGDRAPASANPVAAALLALLDLVGGRCTASALMDLLSRSAVLARFGFVADELPQVERWLGASGVCFGVDAADRVAAGLPDDARNTWRFGLDRLLLGCALPDEDGRLFGGVLPYDDVEGRVTAGVGRLADFAETVFTARAAWAIAAEGPAWRARLRTAAEALLSRRAVDDEQWQAALAPVNALAEAAGAGPLTAAEVAVRLRAAWAARSPGRGAMAGALELAALRADAVVPAPVIVLLGLEAARFPRSNPEHPGADVETRRADAARARARDHRALAEACAAAGRVLLVALDAEGPDGEPAAPSPLLRSVIPDVFETMGDFISGRASIHAGRGAEAGRGAGEKARSGAWAEAAALSGAPFVSAPLPPAPEPTLRLDQLARFLADPLGGFLRRLGVHAASEQLSLRDEPPLMLNGLERWQVADELFARRLQGQALEVAEAALRAAGGLPPGNAGELELNDAAQHAHAVATMVEDTRPPEAPLPALVVDLPLGAVRLVGRVGDRYRAGLLRAQSGKLRAKHLLKAWIEHLAALAMGETGDTVLIGRADTREGWPTRVRLGAPARPAAALLETLVSLYVAGQRAPLPLFPESSLAFVQASPDGRPLGPRDQQSVLRRWGWDAERVSDLEHLVGFGCPLFPERFQAVGALALPVDRLPEAARAIWGPLVAARVGGR